MTFREHSGGRVEHFSCQVGPKMAACNRCTVSHEVRGLHLRFPGAVEFIRVVLTVVVAVTSPRGLDAKAVAALEFIASAVPVEAYQQNRTVIWRSLQ
jgi:hypothetical protein